MHKNIFKIAENLATEKIFLVGGAVRDLYLERKISDYDFAYAGNANDLGRKIAQRLQATYIPLDIKNDVARIVIKNGGKSIFIDIASFKGKNINEDLERRDFTINAMALPLSGDLAAIIDPFNGRGDIAKRKITLIAEANIAADPLRILRGLRLAVCLNYTIDSDVLLLFKKYAPLLKKVSPERIRDELLKSFEVGAFISAKLADETGVIEVLLPEVTATKNVTQNKYHTLDVWQHMLAVLYQLENHILTDELAISPEIKKYLNAELVSGRSRVTLLKFAALIHDIGKPVVKKIDPRKGVIFWKHEQIGGIMAGKIGHRLALANKEIDFLKKVVKYHMRPLFLSKNPISKKAFFRFFNDCGEDGLAVILHALADTKGGKAAEYKGDKEIEALSVKLFDFYFNEYLPQKNNPLLDGKDVLKIFPEMAGREIGEYLQYVAMEYAKGNISNKEQAIDYLKYKYKHR